LQLTGAFSMAQSLLNVNLCLLLRKSHAYKLFVHFCVFSVNEDETLKTIQDVHSEHNYLLCPHSAVGWKSAEMFRAEHCSSGIFIFLNIYYAVAQSPQTILNLKVKNSPTVTAIPSKKAHKNAKPELYPTIFYMRQNRENLFCPPEINDIQDLHGFD
jgi:hypothetical protein